MLAARGLFACGILSSQSLKLEPFTIVVEGFLHSGVFRHCRLNRLECPIGLAHGAAFRCSLGHLNLPWRRCRLELSAAFLADSCCVLKTAIWPSFFGPSSCEYSQRPVQRSRLALPWLPPARADAPCSCARQWPSARHLPWLARLLLEPGVAGSRVRSLPDLAEPIFCLPSVLSEVGNGTSPLDGSIERAIVISVHP